MKVQIDIDVQKIMHSYGLGSSDKARKALATNVRRRCDQYVPFREGHLKNNSQVSSGGRTITYLEPYAQKQYTIPYRHSDPLRGDHWDSRMIANEKGQLVADMEAYVKGRPGK